MPDMMIGRSGNRAPPAAKLPTRKASYSPPRGPARLAGRNRVDRASVGGGETGAKRTLPQSTLIRTGACDGNAFLRSKAGAPRSSPLDASKIRLARSRAHQTTAFESDLFPLQFRRAHQVWRSRCHLRGLFFRNVRLGKSDGLPGAKTDIRPAAAGSSPICDCLRFAASPAPPTCLRRGHCAEGEPNGRCEKARGSPYGRPVLLWAPPSGRSASPRKHRHRVGLYRNPQRPRAVAVKFRRSTPAQDSARPSNGDVGPPAICG